MRIARIAMSGLFSLAIVPMAAVALTFGDSGWTMLIGMGLLFAGTGVVVAMHMARAKREFRYAEPETSSEKISSHLVLLSSAAILAVYSAGYFHTRSAASQFLADAAGDRTAEVATSVSPAAAGDAASADAGATPARESERLSRARAKSAPADPTAEGRYGLGAPVAPDAPPDPKEDLASPSQMVGMDMGGMAMGGSEAQPNAQPGGQSGAQSGDHAGSSNSAAPQGQPAAPAANSKVRYKDGTYLGWGTCRHGDIQASVVVQDGKIASADISKCYTRYPCDVIAQLPGQVVTRQSVNVDYVSGATQSVYAFQQAVAAALAIAQGK